MTTKPLKVDYGYMAARKNRPDRVISFVLMVAFGLVALIAGYATITGGVFDFRSKAATQEVLLKKWTFDTGLESWTASDWASQTVTNGVIDLIIRTTSENRERKEVCTGSEKRGNYKCQQRTVVTQFEPRFEKAAIDTALQYPTNKFKMKLSVILPGMERQRHTVTSSVSPVPLRVPLTIQYKLQGKSTYEAPVPLLVTANSIKQEVSFEFPRDMTLKQVTDIRISFGENRSRANTTFAIDEISLVGLREVVGDPQPTKEYYGVVTQVNDPRGPNNVSGYRLLYSPGDELPSQVYQLQNIKRTIPCPTGAMCKMLPAMVRGFNFSEFVDKQVIINGYVEFSTAKGSENPTMEKTLPILYVTKIRLATSLPCQEIPAGCLDESGAMVCKIGLMEGYQWCRPTPKPQVVSEGCEVAGCSGELCVNAGAAPSRMSACVYRPHYACYKQATCQKQASGNCGWTITQEIASCLESSNPIDYRQSSRGSAPGAQ